jgi:hypothetical protein
MENYVNENAALKKKLEDLELNNKSLLSQLQKMQATLASQQTVSNNNATSSTSTECNCLNTVSTNQFGTLLMVLVLFFAVLLGVWSPLLTKDQISCSTRSNPTSSSSGQSRSSSNSIATSSSQSETSQISSVAGVAALVSASVVGFSALSVKAEPSSKPESESSSEMTDESDALKSRDSSPSNEDELMFQSIENGSSMNAFSANNQAIFNGTNSMARSKTGTTVELTKVRPFIRKLPSALQMVNGANDTSKPNLTITNAGKSLTSSEYVMLNNSNEEGQIFILNLASPSQPPTVSNKPMAFNESQSEPKSNNLPVSILGSKPMKMMGLNPQNYKVINTSSQITKSQTGSNITTPSKLATTRFRVINNPLNSGPVAMNIAAASNSPSGCNPSIIKLNS